MKHLTAGLIALGLVLGATTHAHALPVGLAIAGAIGLAGTAATIVGAAITLVAGLALQFVVGALTRKRGSADVGGTTGKMQTGGVVPRAFPFGDKALVTHSLVYWNSFGQDGKTPNAYVVFVFALSDLPVGGGRAALQALWPNGTKATWNPGGTAGTYGIPIPEFNKDGTDHMWVEVFDGTQTTADSLLVTLFSGDANWPYENTRIGTGVVYVRIICRLNRDLFSGYPSFKFVVKGVPFYDAREDSTAGGDGAQRWSDDSTWAATENPIVVAQNLMRGVSYDGEWFFGAQTVSAAQVPFSAWSAAANECDSEIENEDDTTEAQFRCAGEIRLDMEPADVLDDLMRACKGKIGEIGGVYKPHVGPAGIAVLSITDDDIRTDEDQTFEPFFGLQDIVNSINAKYIEPGEGWTAKDAPALVDAALETEDGGRRQPVDLQYEYVPFSRQVQRQNRATLTDYRRERRHVLPLAPEAWRLEPAIDFIAWTSERNGYSAKLFSVEGATDMDGYLVGVTLKEVDPGDYDDWTSQAPVIAPSPIVFTPSQGIAGADIDGVTVEGAGGRAKAGALLQWNGDDQDDVRAVAFEIKIAGAADDDLTYSGETPESAVSQGSYIVTANLNGATAYEGRLKFVPFTGRETIWSDWIDFTTPDVRVNWGELESATQRGLEAAQGRAVEYRDLLEQLAAQVQGLEQQALDNRATVVRRVEAVSGQASARLLETYTVLASADAATAATVTSLSAQVNDVTSGLPATRTTLLSFQSTQATLNTAVASDITSLNAALTTLGGTVSGQASAIAGLDARVTSTEGVNTSQASQLTSLDARLTSAEGVNTGQATAISGLDARVTSAEGVNTSQASSITSLDSRLTSAEGVNTSQGSTIAAQGSAISGIDTRVTAAEGTISSQGASIVALNSSLSTANGNIAANSSAITSLDSQVTSINGTLGSQASSINSLNTSVGSLSAGGLFQMVAAVSLPGGATSGWRALVKAADSGNFAEAGIEAYANAGGGGAPTGFFVLVGDRGYSRASGSSTLVKILDNDGKFVRLAMADGIATKSASYKRDGSEAAFSPGSGANSGTSGNGWADIVLASGVVLTANTGGVIGASGSKLLVRGDHTVNANTINAFPSASAASVPAWQDYWFELWVRLALRPSGGGADIEIAPPAKFRSTPQNDGFTVSNSMPELLNDVSPAGSAIVDAGTYTLLVQHKVGRTGSSLVGNTMSVKMRGIFTLEAKLL